MGRSDTILVIMVILSKPAIASFAWAVIPPCLPLAESQYLLGLKGTGDGETMGPDDEICLCFHVTQRKVTSFLRVEKPKRCSQLSECQGAGTGCGWCLPFLEKLFRQAHEEGEVGLPTAESYAESRAKYIQAGKGAPPT